MISASILQPLTERERMVLLHIWDGLCNKEIAAALRISPHTVKGHKERLYIKFDVDNTVKLVRKALLMGIVDL